MPIEYAEVLGIDVDIDHPLDIGAADGKKFHAYPSTDTVELAIEAKGYRRCSWKGRLYFTEAAHAGSLVGHKDCLEKFHLLFKGPERILRLDPRFSS